MIQVPLLCSFLLLQHKVSPSIFYRSQFSDIMQYKLHANNLNADYLFHGNTYDLGDGTTACGRRPDAFKFFLAWQAAGSEV
jgi:glutamate decarboxylase